MSGCSRWRNGLEWGIPAPTTCRSGVGGRRRCLAHTAHPHRSLDRLRTGGSRPCGHRRRSVVPEADTDAEPAVGGPTNIGKTMIVEKYRRLHPPTSLSYLPKGGPHPVIVCNPSGPDERRFFAAIPNAIALRWGSRYVARPPRYAVRLMRQTDVRLLVIDEKKQRLSERRRSIAACGTCSAAWQELQIRWSASARRGAARDRSDDHWSICSSRSRCDW
jgi:hypothetical protein